MTEHRIAIIGCGLIGRRRARALGEGTRLVAAVDRSIERAREIAFTVEGCESGDDWREIVARDDVDIVIVATDHGSLGEIATAAVSRGKHVLVEKPGARTHAELLALEAAARSSGSRVRIGFNHRCHRSLRKARALVDEAALGPLMFLRARYGHGGRPGYEKEWRADPRLSGGGELIDQGIHLIDLARWFLGDFAEAEGFAHTYFWDMPVDDNAFLLLRTPEQQVAFLHASATEWKNLFSLEIYGRDGKLHAEGLGGSYGVERLAWYRMLPEMGPPETTIWEYPMADDSWSVEFQDFLSDIELQRDPSPGIGDALAALSIVETIYRKSGYDHHA